MCTLIGAWVFLMENMVYGLPLHVNRSLVNIYGHNKKKMIRMLYVSATFTNTITARYDLF